jgi:outer membrane protein assembly factor BamB
MTTINDLVFVGRGKNVAAVHRETGQIVWENRGLHHGYSTLLLDGDRVIVSSNGYLYCLDALTGRHLWHNPLSGYGVGATSMASVRGGRTDDAIVMAQQESDNQS